MKLALAPALIVLLLSCTNTWGRSKTDIVTLHNGDNVTCEIKSLYAGLLECSTDVMGTLSIEWDGIASISSNYEFQVRYSDGSRHIGRIDSTGTPGSIGIVGDSGAIDSDWLQVVELRPLQTTLKDAMDIYLGAGYDYTKASETSQITLGLDISYEQERSRSALKLRHVTSDTREESFSSTKLNLSRGFFNDRTRRLFRYGNSSYESNDQLALDYRVSLGAGFGRYFIDNHERQLISAIGLQANTERDLAGEQQESLEGALRLEFATWKFDPPELDVRLTLNLYPSLTDSGRLRGDSDLRLRWELYKDLFWDVTAWGVYDNRNIGDGNLDYGVSTGIGWDY
ncbi:MAG: DUF481 domain-containing protein [Proteobacteria bacterium]|nr:DUF481 domain-containing protein [Pseudomonadota bacterium]